MLPVMLQMKIILKTLQVYFEPGKLDGRAEQSVIVFTYTKKLGPRFTQLVGSPQPLQCNSLCRLGLCSLVHIAAS